MRLKSLFYFTLVLAIVAFSSCNGSVSKAQRTGRQIFQYLQSQDYDALRQMIDTAALRRASFDRWLAVFSRLQQQRGKITDFRQTGIEFFYDKNQNFIVKIHYKVFHNFTTYNETLILIKRHNSHQFKLLGYDY